MEEEQSWKDYSPKIIYTDIIYPFRNNSENEEQKEESKGEKIKKGMKTSVKKIGRPSAITDNMVSKAFKLWEDGQITQKEIAEKWNVSERTVRRKFKNYKNIL